MNVKLLGTWRQKKHTAMINGILCEIIPVEDVFWRFAESGLITQLTRDEIKAVHEVAEYSDKITLERVKSGEWRVK